MNVLKIRQKSRSKIHNFIKKFQIFQPDFFFIFHIEPNVYG